MTRGLQAFAFTLLVSRAPRSGAAEGAHAEHAADWGMFGFHVFGLAVLVGVLVYFVREPIQTLLRDRSDGLRRQLDDARAALDAANQTNAAIRARLDRIADENESLVREAAELAEQERARALERARAAAERVREEAKRSADSELDRARTELRREAAQLAISLAGDMVRTNLTPDDERRMVGEFVERVGRPT